MKNRFGIEVFDSNESLGRFSSYDEDSPFCKGIDCFSADENMKILPCKALKRKSFQTQVYDLPYNKHIRTRASHTYEVRAFSSFTSCSLGLNNELCNAESLGHDLGHFPFGHTTEDVITDKVREESGYSKLEIDHVLMGLIVCSLIERNCDGLNLSYETMEGILYHSTGKGPFSIDSKLPQEYSVLRYMDKVAYVFADINDAERLGKLNPNDDEFKPIYDSLKIIEKNYPCSDGRFSRSNQRARSYTCIDALVKESKEEGCVSFSKGDVFFAFDATRKLMYSLIYDKINWNPQNDMTKMIYEILSKCSLSDYKRYCGDRTESFIKKRREKKCSVSDDFYLPHPAVIISLMTDFDINTLIDRFKSRKQLGLSDILFETPLHEMVPYLLLKEIPIVQLGKDWGEYGKSNPRKFLRNFLKEQFGACF